MSRGVFDRVRPCQQERDMGERRCSRECHVIRASPTRIVGIEVMSGSSPPHGYTIKFDECVFPLNSQLRRQNGVVTIGVGACYIKTVR